MIIYAKVVYGDGAYEHDSRSREGSLVPGMKEFCIGDYAHIRNEPLRRNADDFIVCDSIDINRYDTEDHFELVAKTGKVARHFHFTKVIHVEIDEEVPEE